MNHVYVILYNNSVSSTGYNTIVGAINFIENRNNKPMQKKGKGWLWIDSKGNEYKIKEIKIV
ncbi:hypothetical protein CF086_17165 [Clostridium botulinum]|uniref:hypothetical protein n=1 Tax=Clostridium botulinum TaxID=1491 RepID=UPI0007734642|nr:hypothetical protein [Clostridium botulinum]MBN3352027.1 hypothetical protein [Clostridium botulinum]